MRQYLLPSLLAMFVIISVFFSEKFIPPLVILISIVFLFEKSKVNTFKAVYGFLSPFLIYVSVYALYSFISKNFIASLEILERQVLIIILPVLILSSSLNKKRNLFFIKAFVFFMLITFVVSVVLFVDFIVTNQDWIAVMNRIKGDLTYIQFKFPHLIGVHPTYWSYLLVITNIILLNNSKIKLFNNNVVVVTLLIIFNINLFYLSARTPIAINLIIHIVLLFYFWIKHKQINNNIVIYLFVFLGMVFFFVFQPLMVSKILITFKDDRFYLWPKAFEVIKNNYFILGEGLGDGNRLLKEYIFDVFDSRKNYFGTDLHNQYLKAYLDMGILGFLSLVYLLISPLVASLFFKKNIEISIGFTILFMLCILTESTFYVVKGIVIFVVFSSILIKDTVSK